MTRSNLNAIGMTYIPGVSDTIKRQLKQHAPDLKVALRPACKVAQLYTDTKHKLETGQESNVVYAIYCKQCKGMYIGETTQKFYDRCTQHANDVKNATKKPRKSALVAHASKSKHEFDFNNGIILKKVRAKGLLKIHEANQIILHENVAVNFKKDARHITPIFYNLIKKSKKRKKLRTVNPANLPSYKWNETTTNSQSEPTESSEQLIL